MQKKYMDRSEGRPSQGWEDLSLQSMLTAIVSMQTWSSLPQHFTSGPAAWPSWACGTVDVAISVDWGDGNPKRHEWMSTTERRPWAGRAWRRGHVSDDRDRRVGPRPYVQQAPLSFALRRWGIRDPTNGTTIARARMPMT